MIGHALKHTPQTIFLHTEAKPLLKHIRSLLEHQHFQAVAHAPHIRRSPVKGQSTFADYEQIVTGQVSIRTHLVV